MADGTVCGLPSVYTVVPAERPTRHNENVDEGVQVGATYKTSVHSLLTLFVATF